MRDRLRAALGPAADVGRGAAIGTAEAVPGVSGGTVALIVGVYERLVSSLGTLAGAVPALLRCDAGTARRCAAAVDWRLIVPLAAGAAVDDLDVAYIAVFAAGEEGALHASPADASALVVLALAVGGAQVKIRLVNEMTNPGLWMAHCHIAEHHERGMMFNFNVEA